MAHFRLNASVVSAAVRSGKLDLHGRSLHEVPLDCFDGEMAPALTILDLSENKIMEIPSAIQLMQNLEYLYLDNNALQQLPMELLSLPNLKGITLEGNPRLNPELMQVFYKAPNVVKSRARVVGPVLAWLANQGRPSGSPLQGAGRAINSRQGAPLNPGYDQQLNGEQDDYLYAELRARASQAANSQQQQQQQYSQGGQAQYPQGGYQNMPSPKSSHGVPRSFGDQQNHERQAMQARVAAAQLRGSGPDSGNVNGSHAAQSNANDAQAARLKAHNQSSNVFSTGPYQAPRGRRSGAASPAGGLQSPFGTDLHYDTLKGRQGPADLNPGENRSNIPSPFAVQGSQIMNSQPRGNRSGQATPTPAPYGTLPSTSNAYISSAASAHLQVQAARAQSGAGTPNGSGSRSGYASPHIRDQTYPPAPPSHQPSNFEKSGESHSRRASGQFNAYGAHTPVNGIETPSGNTPSRHHVNNRNHSSIFDPPAEPQRGKGHGARVIQDTRLW